MHWPLLFAGLNVPQTKRASGLYRRCRSLLVDTGVKAAMKPAAKPVSYGPTLARHQYTTLQPLHTLQSHCSSPDSLVTDSERRGLVVFIVVKIKATPTCG